MAAVTGPEIVWLEIRCPRCGETWRTGYVEEAREGESPAMHYCGFKVTRAILTGMERRGQAKVSG